MSETIMVPEEFDAEQLAPIFRQLHAHALKERQQRRMEQQ